MHHHQHGTRPRVTVFYLHPERLPLERSWEEVEGEQHKGDPPLASMVGWARYDEKTGAGLKPPGDFTYCSGCRWNKGGQCEARLGPKQEGEWDHRWEKLGATNQAAAPQVDVVEPPAPAAFEEDEPDEPDEEEIEDANDVPADAVATLSESEAAAAAVATPAEPTAETAPPPAFAPLTLHLGTEETRGTAVGFPAADLRTHVAVAGLARVRAACALRVAAAFACAGLTSVRVASALRIPQHLGPPSTPHVGRGRSRVEPARLAHSAGRLAGLRVDQRSPLILVAQSVRARRAVRAAAARSRICPSRATPDRSRVGRVAISTDAARHHVAREGS